MQFYRDTVLPLSPETYDQMSTIVYVLLICAHELLLFFQFEPTLLNKTNKEKNTQDADQ